MTNIENKKKDMICAGVVTYNPDIGVLDNNLSALCPQVNEVFIVDNGSSNKAFISDLLRKYSNATVQFNDENLGIAQALNQLCGQAYKEGYLWIVTMDQDSVCDTEMIEKLSSMKKADKGIIAPRVEFRDDGMLIETTHNKNSVVEGIDACITSGSMTNLEAWRTAGGFDEWLFIDHVDNEFCAHIKKHGYKIIRVNEALLYQRAGDMKHIMLFGKPIMLPYYSNFRNYYICRNTVYFIRKYWRDINLFREIRSFVYSQSIKLIFERGRLRNLKSSVRGIWAGRKKKKENIEYCSKYI